jgi:hypothetical protein
MSGEDEASTIRESGTGPAEKSPRRKIQGNLPYTSSPGTMKRVLESIPISEKPSIFTTDFLGTVMGATGGSARAIIPIFKTCGLLTQSGTPTEIYSEFQTDSGRSNAALKMLKSGFPEIFKRNQFAHRATDAALIDIIVAITGLPKTEPIVRYILNTFQTFQQFAKKATEVAAVDSEEEPDKERDKGTARQSLGASESGPNVGLIYNINVVLPETTNVDVYNAIFKSLKGNLLQ